MKKNKLFLLSFSLLFSISGCLSKIDIDKDEEPPVDERVYEDIENSGNWNERKNVWRNSFVTIDKATIRDKVLGCLIGNAIGLGSGFEYIHGEGLDSVTPEGTKSRVALGDQYFETDGYLLCGTLGENNDKSNCEVNPPKTLLCDPRVGSGWVVSDDDMHVDIMLQYLLREKGPFIDAYDVMNAWSNNGYAVHDAGGGGNIRDHADNLQFLLPYLGQQLYGNDAWYITEPWIESDMIGIDFPYMPRSCDVLASFVGSGTGDGYANYLGRLLAIMTSLTYQYDDAKMVMEKAFDYCDKDNKIYEMYQFVKSEYENNVPWREACVKIADRRIWTNNKPTDGSNPAMPAGGFAADFSLTSNAGTIFLGLFYGENDFVESVKITSLAGLDGDCTAASVGQIMGTMVGFDALPERYQNCLNGDSYYYNYSGGVSDKEEWSPGWDYPFAFCAKNMPYKTSFNQLTDLIVDNIENQIVAFGGTINEETYDIAKQDLPSSSYIDIPNFSFEDGNTEGWLCDGGTLEIVDTNANFRVKDSRTSAKLTGYGKAYQNVTLIPGHSYNLSLYVQRECDEEIRLFANDMYSSFIRTSEYVSKGTYYRHNLTFVASEADYNIGIELVNSGRGTSTSVNFDDLEIADVTNYYESYYQGYDINYFYGNEGTTNINGNAVLTSNSSLKVEFMGYEGLQNFRFYLSNTNDSVETLSLYIDNQYRGKLPIQSNGEIDFEKIGTKDALLYAGKGKHILKVTLSSGSSLVINKIEIQGTNPFSDRGIISE